MVVGFLVVGMDSRLPAMLCGVSFVAFYSSCYWWVRV